LPAHAPIPVCPNANCTLVDLYQTPGAGGDAHSYAHEVFGSSGGAGGMGGASMKQVPKVLPLRF
jgi:hypothetical protein